MKRFSTLKDASFHEILPVLKTPSSIKRIENIKRERDHSPRAESRGRGCLGSSSCHKSGRRLPSLRAQQKAHPGILSEQSGLLRRKGSSQ